MNTEVNSQLPIQTLYDSRTDFTIIGLTGLAGSGCSYLANIMANRKFYEDKNKIRCAEGLDIPEVTETTNSSLFANSKEKENNNAINKLVFKRKYTICQNFIKENYKPYIIIKYTDVIWLYTLLYLCKKCKINTIDFSDAKLRKDLSNILTNKYALSHENIDASYQKERGYSTYEIFDNNLLANYDFTSLINEVKDIVDACEKNDFFNVRGTAAAKMSSYFFDKNSSINKFIKYINTSLEQKDYFCLLRFYHRLSSVIRATGDPLVKSESIKTNNDCSHLYNLVKLINVLIKGYKIGDDESFQNRRFVIDSLKNSLEALYLKERYTAFYLIAVHDKQNREQHIKQRIRKSITNGDIEKVDPNLENLIYERIEYFSKIEANNKDYENGKFHSPNISQCIADAEIHLINNLPQKNNIPFFYTLEEQWMKYASLILHPGLISPSAEERCMMVAYTAKFNSGCLSRQVGAVITNQYHSIRSIGWNDVPYGQVPCALRDLRDLITCQSPYPEYFKYMYSKFEQSGEPSYDENKRTFIEKIKQDYKNVDNQNEQSKGLPFSYCFKTLENRYSGEKNQVYTRSLHAEENAMLQMVKYGGESLMNGIIYVTASPCELCSKKLYQIGVRKIVYIDPYPGHSKELIIGCGYKRPELQPFQGAYGCTYFKLYQPFMSYKDEFEIRTNKQFHQLHSDNELFNKFMNFIGMRPKATYTAEEFEVFMQKINDLKKDNK